MECGEMQRMQRNAKRDGRTKRGKVAREVWKCREGV